ncbi:MULTISPECIES: alpha/beta fold hydrolase [Brevibacillus]|uniref:alpha/beta fold hydrolase n=1 Tax=Brevibacillus TaxID=55080 RepID=UPI00156BC0D6|nr:MULTISPECIES: alpha/beta hydrolase [Brevibacillus]MBU8712392.1 alpha/beta fold hydrolase [Brevibacillus parabrevis]UED71681.1 alpha/beta hydrolase [Brevibacillus sp. HD3.3A]WDV97913.1 alpha/beta hydrolase [Brevibacillus parabrevis]
MTTQHQAATRKYFSSQNLRLSYLDFGGDSPNVLLCLHGHMNDGRVFAEFASKLSGWRVISLDQRGHGWSEHSPEKDYSRNAYVQDILAFVQNELGGQQIALLGHSLGGLNAYQFAARYPAYVKALIVEDIGTEIHVDLSFVERLPQRSASLEELKQSLRQVGVRAVDYFAESVLEDEHGFAFRSDLSGMRISQEHCNGEWWTDWLASACPALLIHGKHSFVMDEAHAKLMAERRANTRLAVFAECGHDIHSSDPDGFQREVQVFLDEIARS